MKRPKKILKETKGISIISLSVTLIIMLMILGAITFSLINANKTADLDSMFQDISLMNDKVNVYYWKYGKLPVKSGAENRFEKSQLRIPEEAFNPNDYGDYYALDTSALENLSNINKDNTYIINEGSHTIYVAEGVEVEGVTYYTEPETYTQVFGQIVSTYKVKTDGDKSVIHLHVEELVDGIKEIVFPNGSKKTYEADTKKVDETYEVTESGEYIFTATSNDANVGTETITVNVKYGITYSIAFHAHGGTGSMANQTGFVFGVGKALTANAFTNPGYTFAGWNTQEDGTGAKFIDKAVLKGENLGINEVNEGTGEITINLYAQWSARTDTPYTIQYYKQKLTNPNEYELDTKETVTRLGMTGASTDDYSKDASGIFIENKSINGFTYDSSHKDSVLSANISGDGSTILKLYYTRNIYNINYVLNGGTNSSENPETYAYESGITLHDPSKEGYDFTGWTGEEGPNVTQISTDSEGDKTYTANWQYAAQPVITRTAYNSFTFTATAGAAYWVSTSSTAPSAGSSAVQSTFGLGVWTTATNTGNLSLASGVTYYVWAKDAVTGGQVSSKVATIVVRTVTRSQGTGTTLTTKLENENGEAFTTSPKYVLDGTPIYAVASNNDGYHSATVTLSTGSLTNNIATITANTTITSSATANKVTINIKNGTVASTVGYSVSLSTSSSNDTATKTATNSNGTVEISPVPNGTYYIWSGKNSNATTTMLYSGQQVVVNDNNPSAVTVQYYGLTLKKGAGISAVNNVGTSTESEVQHLYNSSNPQSIAIDATVATEYTWSTWTKTSGINLATFTAATKSQSIKMGAGATTLTASATYTGQVTITRSDFNTFTYTAPGGAAYWVSTSSTAPSAGSTAAQSTFGLEVWTTATNTGNLSLAAGTTYYVWAKDATTGGLVSTNKATIAVRTVTRSQGTGTTLTTKLETSSGTSFTDSPKYVLDGTKIYAVASNNDGYHSATVTLSTGSLTNNIATITANTTITSSATANKVTINIKNGTAASTVGYSVSLSTSSSNDTATKTATNSNGTVEISPVPNGIYYIWSGKNSNATTTRIYSGKTVTVSDNSPSAVTVQYYGLTLKKGAGISAVSNAGTSTESEVQHLYNSDSPQSIAIDATVATGHTWSTWTKTSGTDLATFTSATKSQSIKMGAGATTLTASATYTGQVTITRSDFNTFTYTAPGGAAYWVSTSSTAPSAGSTAAQSTFGLEVWTTATNTGNLSLAGGTTYYVWAKDAVTGGLVSTNKATIAVRTVTRSVGRGSSLTTKFENSSGTAFDDSTKCVLNGTKIYAVATANTGYNTPTVTLSTGTLSNNIATITANTTITSSVLPNTNTAYVVKHYTHNIGEDKYTLVTTETNNLTGTTDATLTLANLASTTLTTNGFKYVNGFDTDKGTTKPTSGSVATTTILPDGTRVISLYYRRNYLYIQYDMNGGSLAETHGDSIGTSGTLITSTSNSTATNFFRGVYGGNVTNTNTTTYAQGDDGIHDCNYQSGINITRSGYKAQIGAEWNTAANGSGTSYNQTVSTYAAATMATAAGANLKTGDAVIKLYVNWVQTNYTEYDSSNNAVKYYSTLASALSGVTNGNTIKATFSGTSKSEAAATLASGKTATLDLNGKTITMTATLTNAGTLTITGTGTLTASTAIHTVTNTGTLTKSGTSTISNTTTTADRYVIHNSGTATISAGTVSATNAAIGNAAAGKFNVTGGTITAGGCTIFNNGTSTSTSTPSIKISNGTVESTGNFAINNNSTGRVVVSGGTVTSSGNIGIYNGSSGIIAASGGTVSSSANNAIYNYSTGSVTISGATVTQSAGNSAIANNSTGTITVSSGTVQNTGSSYGINNAGDGTVTISGGTVKSKTANTIRNGAAGTVSLTGGTIKNEEGSNCTVYNMAGGTVTVAGATVTHTGTGNTMVNGGAGKITVSSGSVTSSSKYAINNTGAGNIEVTGGSVTGSTYAIYNSGTANTESNPAVKITNGTVTSAGNTVANAGSGLILISGGTIDSTQTGSRPTVINTTGGNKIVITGGTINGANDRAVCQYDNADGIIEIRGGTINGKTGVNASTGTVKITGGTITGSTTGASASSTGILIVGNNSNAVSQTAPAITGTTNGVYNSGTFKFYDGVLKGATSKSIVGDVNDVPANYGVKKTTASSVETAILERTYNVSFNANMFSAYNREVSGLTISYNPTTSILTLNGTWSAKSASFGILNGLSFADGEKVKATLTYQSGSYTSTVNPQIVTELQKDGANYDGRTSGTHYRVVTVPTSSTGTATGTLTVGSSTTDANGIKFYLYQSTAGATTFDNYQVKVNISRVYTTQTIINTTKYSGFPATPKRIGYTFEGWYTAESGGTKVTTSTTMNVSSDHTLYAQWTANVLTVNFYANNATHYGSQTITDAGYTATGIVATRTYDYGAVSSSWTSSGLPNYGTSTGSIPITRTGYSATGDYHVGSASSETIVNHNTGFPDGVCGFASAIDVLGDFQNGNKTVKLYAGWTPKTNTAYVVKHYTHNIGANTYTLVTSETNNLTGTSDASLTLANLKSSTLTSNGFTYVNGFNYDAGTTKPSSGAVTTTTILPDGTRVISLYYRRNYLYIQYDMNGGSLAETHGTSYGSSGSLVTNTGNSTATNFFRGVYGTTVNNINVDTYVVGTSGLHDYNATSSINIERSGYVGQIDLQWNTAANGSGTSFGQADATIDAAALATAAGKNLKTGDAIVKLYVNWVQTNYTEYEGETTTKVKYYNTLSSALSGVTNENTIKATFSGTSKSEAAATLASGKAADLNLNGKTITMTGTLTNNGTLVIEGSGTLTASTAIHTVTNVGTFTKAGTSTISNTSEETNKYAIHNSGTATVSAGTVSSTKHTIGNSAAGKFNVTGGTVSSSGGYAVYNNGTATGTSKPSLKITGGTVSSSGGNTIYNNSTGTVYVNGGTVTQSASNATVNNRSSGEIKIASGTISNTGTTYAIYNNDEGGKVTVSGGTVSSVSNNAIRNYGGTGTAAVTVSGGTVTCSSSNTIRNDASGTVTVSGGTVKQTGSSSTIYNYGAGTVKITGGTVQNTGTSYAINNGDTSAATGALTITGGTVSVAGNARAIYSKSTGKITIGTSGGTSTTVPEITGMIYGDSTDCGDVTVHCGKITGTTSGAILSKGNKLTINGGSISASGSYAVYSSSNSSATLTIAGGTISETGNYYAVTTTNSTGATVKITGGTITRSTGTDGAVNNRLGSTTITGGTITSTEGVGVYATTGTIIIGNNSDAVSTSVPNITGGTYGVQTEGTFKFYDGQIKGADTQALSKDPDAKPTGYTVRKKTTSGVQKATLGNTYTITYYLGNGETTAGRTKLGTQTVTYGTATTLNTFADDLDGIFPYSAADNTTNGNTNYGWVFAGWSTSGTGTSINYTNGQSYTHSSEAGFSLYAVGSKVFKFNGGIAPTEPFNTQTQYWNPYQISASYMTSITIPQPVQITNGKGWDDGFYGYRGGSNAANSSVTYAASTAGTTIKPEYNIYGTMRSVYKRTTTLAYNKNGGSGSTTSSTKVQYYNSGYGTGSANKGATLSTPSFTLATSTFTPPTGKSFRKWAENSGGTGTLYAAGATFNTWTPAVDATPSKTMYATWSANIPDLDDQTLTAPYKTSSQTVTIEGATNGSGTYTYSISPAVSGFSISGTTITISASKAAGTYTLSVKAKDTNSNLESSAATITIKIQYPALTLNPNYTDASTRKVYPKYGTNKAYTTATGTTEASITESRDGYTLLGWYDASSNGNKVLDASGAIVGAVSGYTNSSKQWIMTTSKTLWAHWSYTATPTITRKSATTFSYTATAGVAYYVSTSSTAPSAGSTAAQSTFELNKWTTAKTTTSFDFTATGTYYVWVKDAKTGGNVSSNKASIAVRQVTRSVGTGTTLTTKLESSSGTSITTSPFYVFNGTKIYAVASANTGYKDPVVTVSSGTLTNNIVTITANTTITSSATLNTVTVNFAGQGINTSFGDEPVTLDCSGTNSPTKQSSTLTLAANQKYCISFDYKCSTGSNKFSVDLYPDSLPQINPTATTTTQHEDWIIQSSDSNMTSCKLRIFDATDSSTDTGTITVSNIVIRKVTSTTYTYGGTLGTLASPTRAGYELNGWYTASVGGSKISSSTAVPSSEKTYFTHWDPKTITITYYGNGGKWFNGSVYTTEWSEEITFGKNYEVWDNFYTAPECYRFGAWTTNNTGVFDNYGWTGWSGPWVFDNGQYGVANNALKLYAGWYINHVEPQSWSSNATYHYKACTKCNTWLISGEHTWAYNNTQMFCSTCHRAWNDVIHE